MKSWNLSEFEELAPSVLTITDKEATVEIPRDFRSLRNAPRARRVKSVAGLSATVLLVAAISAVPLQLSVTGTDRELRFSSEAAITNAKSERPPLTLLFGAAHPRKWSQEHESEMLLKAALVLEAWQGDDEQNLIHSVLREELPAEPSSDFFSITSNQRA